MPILNPGFEIVGVPASGALNWSWSPASDVEFYVRWGPGNDYDAETFDVEWSSNETYLFSFTIGTIVTPLFGTDFSAGEAFEDFEGGWSMNHGYSFEFLSYETALFNGAFDEDTFEASAGWVAGAYWLVMGPTTAAQFDTAPENFEDFEEGWFSGTYQTVMGATTAAAFDDGNENFENFEDVFGPLIPTSINFTTSTFTRVLHGLVNGDIVNVSPSTGGGLLPSPLQTDTTYYVVGATADTFQIAATSGGAAIVMIAAGAGVSFVRDPLLYWPVDGPR